MTGRRAFLYVTAALFFGWLGWLGYAVLQKGKSPVVSRAQITASTHLLVAKVEVGEDGLPADKATVTKVLRGDGVGDGAVVEVLNLPSAMPPGATKFPGTGEYLLPVVADGKTFRLAGVPRSPGYEPPAPARPAVYRWDGDTEAQLRGLGLTP